MSIEEQVQSQIEMCSRCCLHPNDLVRENMVKKVLAWWDSAGEYADGTERSGYVLFETDDGKFAVFEDGEDYTGHGCQCDSTLTVFDTYADALVLGLTEAQAECLKLEKRRSKALAAREGHEN
jgi:hypothetical protein